MQIPEFQSFWHWFGWFLIVTAITGWRPIKFVFDMSKVAKKQE